MSYSYENLIRGVKKSWLPMFEEIFNNEKGKELFDYLNSCDYTIYPKPEHVFNAFKFFDLKETNIVLLGQDPYIGFETDNKKEIPQAMGLSFSVSKEIKKIPPSIKNIFKEIKNSFPDYGIPNHGDLTEWVKNNNLLLLNAALTVKQKKSNHHQKKWMKFTNKIIDYISDNTEDVIFILLGNFAKGKSKLIDLTKHKIISGVHPSPLSASRGFFGSDIFKKINTRLSQLNKTEFNYNLENK